MALRALPGAPLAAIDGWSTASGFPLSPVSGAQREEAVELDFRPLSGKPAAATREGNLRPGVSWIVKEERPRGPAWGLCARRAMGLPAAPAMLRPYSNSSFLSTTCPLRSASSSTSLPTPFGYGQGACQNGETSIPHFGRQNVYKTERSRRIILNEYVAIVHEPATLAFSMRLSSSVSMKNSPHPV